MRRLCALLLLGCLVLPAHVAGADDASPGSPDWEDRDVEGKWVAYQRALKEDGGVKGAWMQWLAKSRDFELLEWVAIYDKWEHSGRLLAELNAPHWLRAALWTLHDRRSHSFDAASETLLLKRPGDVLGYVEKYPEALTPSVKAIVKTIKEKYPKAVPTRDLEALPPLRAEDVYRALSAPAKLKAFGTRLRAAPGDVYLHQVLRAIDARRRHHPLDATVRDQFLALARHADPRVRMASVRALASLPPAIFPVRALYYIANDERETIGVREAATSVAGRSKHPALHAWLLDLAYQPDHPLWIAAMAALGDRFEGFLLEDEAFAGVAPTGTARVAALAAEKKRLYRRWANTLRESLKVNVYELLVRAAWLEVTQHPRAMTYRTWLLGHLRTHRDARGVRKLLSTIADAPTVETVADVTFAPGSVRAPTAERLRAALGALARAVLK